MTAGQPRNAPTLHPLGVAATADAAARYIADRLAFQRLLEATDPTGWDLARHLAALADHLDADLNTAHWVEQTLPHLEVITDPNQ